jgi:hypothetical protein
VRPNARHTAAERNRSLLRACLLYLSAILVGNLIWESLQLPLYTIWEMGTPREQAFAVLHCTAGDVLIAASTLGVALLLMGQREWPVFHFKRVAFLSIALAVAYTAFSEWLNTSIRGSWAYSALMPVISFVGLEIGLSPLLQWIVVPSLSFVLTRYYSFGGLRRSMREVN